MLLSSPENSRGPRPKAAVLFTGGKDSTFACGKLLEKGFRITCLITIFSDNEESYMLHTSSIEVTHLSAKALGIPIVTGRTRGQKEEELEEIKKTVEKAQREYDFELLAGGGIASTYQKTRFEKIAIHCRVEPVSPLWGLDQTTYLHLLLREGYKFLFTSVSANGLDSSWLGKEIGEEEIKRLLCLSKKFGFNAALEGGEGETLVLDCPLFKKYRLKIVDSNVLWNGYYGRLMIKRAELVKKTELV